VIKRQAFQNTQLKELVIPESLQYIEARMHPSTVELLLTSKSTISKFQKWKVLVLIDRNTVMKTRR
jgi:hypothetical protein